MLLKNEDDMICPHCRKRQGDYAIDYTLAYKEGTDSRVNEDCCDCLKPYTAERKGKDHVLVTAL